MRATLVSRNRDRLEVDGTVEEVLELANRLGVQEWAMVVEGKLGETFTNQALSADFGVKA